MSKPVPQRGRRSILVAFGAELFPSLMATAVAGFLVAGIGGRLAMFILRVTSGSEVIGLESDDGFIIGRFTADTFFLVLLVTVFPAFFVGPAYAVMRRWFPSRWRTPVFALFLAVLGGALLVHADGIDFTALSPRILAVALFVAIPAAFGAVLEPLHELARRQMHRLPEGALLVVPILASGVLILAGPRGMLLGVLGWGIVMLGQGERVGQVLRSRVLAWAGRLGMLVLAGVAVSDLMYDLKALF